MKIGGVVVTPCEELLVLPRPEGAIPFRAKAVSINDEFDAKVPMPTPPKMQVKGGKFKEDYGDKNYLQAVDLRNSQRFAFMCIKSLEPSEIEWSTVDLNKPATWGNWTKDLMEAGISEVEIGRIINLVMVANSLDEKKIEEARKLFLLGQDQ